MKKYSRHVGLFAAITIGINPVIFCYDQAFMDHVMTRYVTSFGMPKKPSEPEKIGFFKAFKTLCYGKAPVAEELSREMQRALAQNLQSLPLLSQSVIDKGVIDKMELVHGEANALTNLATTLSNDYTLFATELGKKRFIEMLAQPTTDITLIKQRQILLRELVSNEQLLSQVHAILKSISGKTQSIFLGILNAEYSATQTPTTMSQFKSAWWLNKTWVHALISGSSYGTFGSLACTTFSYAATIAALGMKALRDINNSRYRSSSENAMISLGVGAGVTVVSGACLFYTAILYGLMRNIKNAVNLTQEYLIETATCIRTMQQLYQTLNANKTFETQCPALQEFVSLNGYSNNHSSNFNVLIRRLETDTFKGSPSFFSMPGRTGSTQNILLDCDIRKELLPAANALAELDVLVALARKIKKQKKYGVHYCFVEFEEDKQVPHITGTNFWNPLLDASKAVTNSFTLGAHNPKQPHSSAQNVILTGPNTGGKSTFIKALMLNELLAHTFGIAAADRFVTTPFAKLSCHMNINDDTAGGVSLFQAEINRAKDLVTLLKSLPANEFAFIIIDEIFTGTAPAKAEQLSCQFVKQLSEFKNCIFISTTHFDKMIELEKITNGTCKNFHMNVIADAQGRVTKYTYQIAPGPSLINNAEQLAQENNILF